MDEIYDQAGLIGMMKLPPNWYGTIPDKTPVMCIMLPSGALTHEDGSLVIPKIEYLPPSVRNDYAWIFENYGVNDYTVGACCKVAYRKIANQIDNIKT